MFAIHHHQGSNGSPMDAPSFLIESSNDVLTEPLLSKSAESPFGEIDNDNNLALFEHYSESGPSSVHVAQSDAASDSNTCTPHGERPLAVVGASPGGVKEEAGIELTSQLPTPSQEVETNISNFTTNGLLQPAHFDSHQFPPLQHHHLPPVSNMEAPTANGILLNASSTPQKQTKPNPSSSSLSEAQLLDSPRSRTQTSPDYAVRTPGSSRRDMLIELRARASIPNNLNWWEFQRQCALAAYSSRLNPYALHQGEYRLLKDHITLPQVSIYLNIRNAILRLWTRSPLVPVRMDEAAGCARDSRYFALADVAFNWLMRQGYINFGCLHLPTTAGPIPRNKSKGGRRRTIIVIGAGMSGLGCARQLDGLIAQLGHHWTDRGERPPKVVVLEGRRRIGGRVYSHMLRKQSETLPTGLRSTAEMGAQIVTGFDHGNPMDIIIRGQLALHVYGLNDNSILYDHDGKVVDKTKDIRVETLYNDVLERASVFRNIFQPPRTVEGDRELMQQGKEPPDVDGKTISELENDGDIRTQPDSQDANKLKAPKQTAISTEKLTGRAYQIAGLGSRVPAGEAAKKMGWELINGTDSSSVIHLQPPLDTGSPGTLGDTMEDALRQYQKLIRLTPEDLRLFNWHNANLEYANAANVSQLSLTGWDQDLGNEFEGEHSEVIGGYSQVPRGIWQSPYPLDVRFEKKVTAIQTPAPGEQTLVQCADGETLSADHVVVSVPLGVLKTNSINFFPPLPESKTGAIERLGFGLLNKVVLVYEKAFWEEDRDMFGLLNEAQLKDSVNPKDYAANRGRFYLFWNCIKTSGRPTLVALMAGESAYQAESESNESLIGDLTSRLRKMFGTANVPKPSESIITRWKHDPFANGSYSYVGPATRSDDYEAMAQRVGAVHFAGEATCGTHPATVHGAYLSGLRAASEIIDEFLGPIPIPTPLVQPNPKSATKINGSASSHHASPTALPGQRGLKRGYAWVPDMPQPAFSPATSSSATRNTEAEDYEARIIHAILTTLGPRPIKPQKQGVNPFLLYQKDHWYRVKSECDAAQHARLKAPMMKASKHDVRSALGEQWRFAPDEVKRPYLDRAEASKSGTQAAEKRYVEEARVWDDEAARVRGEFVRDNPLPGGAEKRFSGRTAVELGRPRVERNGGTVAEGVEEDRIIRLPTLPR